MTGRITETLAELLSMDVVGSDFGTVLASVEGVDGTVHRALLGMCEDALREPGALNDVTDRIACARITVAMLPATLPYVREWLERRDSPADYEVHFTLFCYLDWCREMPQAASAQPGILRLVREYLASVRADTARAASMAGDLLGDHWPLDEALPVLLDLVLKARYAAGRYAALSGVQTASRKGLAPEQSRQVEVVLKQAVSQDRSHGVRGLASLILDKVQRYPPVNDKGQPAGHF